MPSAPPRRRRVFDGILSRAELAFVRDQPQPDGSGFEWVVLRLGLEQRAAKSKASRAWRAARDIELRNWIRHHPGTRPQCWWAFDSPEPQRPLARGSGRPLDLDLVCGAPAHWLDLSRDAAIESQAAFLKRHGLMTVGESSRVPASAYAPEPIAARTAAFEFPVKGRPE